MYHQFDRSMHPRQSVLNTILTLKEKSQKAESTLRALEDVSDVSVLLCQSLILEKKKNTPN